MTLITKLIKLFVYLEIVIVTLVEWVKTVKPDSASKVLSTYAIIMAVLQLVLQVAASVADGGLANGLPVAAWALIWWNTRQKNFQAIFYISLFYMVLQVIGAAVLFNAPNTQYLNISNPILITLTIFSLMLWSFPAAVAHNINRRLKESVSGEPHGLSSKEVPRYQKTEKNTYADKRYKNETIEATDTEVEIDKANLNSKLAEKYSKAWIAIQYRPEASIGWKQIQSFPIGLKLSFLEKLTSNPQQDVGSLLTELTRQHQKIIAPFEDEKLNKIYSKLLKVNSVAANEFKTVLDTLGKTVDPEQVAQRLIYRHGKIGRHLAEHREMLGGVVYQNENLNSEFKKLFEAEFSSFVIEKKLQNKNEKVSWRLFINHLFELCGWEAKKP